jgi:thymidylate synthase (FAD)
MTTVKLIHSTTDGDDLIAYMARVSNPANQNTKDSARLISYLIKHNHWSPFEMVNMCVEIETTRSIAAQILRHRSFSFQEFSQRYAAVTEPAIVPELRRQDTKNRQNSIDDLNPYDAQGLRTEIARYYVEADKLYQRLLSYGVAKECAREVLPLATPTRLYMNGTLRSWIHYCNLRCGNGTQLEHKRIADACKALIQQSFPGTYKAVFAVSE